MKDDAARHPCTEGIDDMTPSDITAAAERRRKHDEAMRRGKDRDSPYRTDYSLQARDTAILADAYLALGERREDEWRVIHATGGGTISWTFRDDEFKARKVASIEGGQLVRVATFVKPVEE